MLTVNTIQCSLDVRYPPATSIFTPANFKKRHRHCPVLLRRDNDNFNAGHNTAHNSRPQTFRLFGNPSTGSNAPFPLVCRFNNWITFRPPHRYADKLERIPRSSSTDSSNFSRPLWSNQLPHFSPLAAWLNLLKINDGN